MSEQIRCTVRLGQITCRATPIDVDIIFRHVSPNDKGVIGELLVIKQLLRGELTAFYDYYGFIGSNSCMSVQNDAVSSGKELVRLNKQGSKRVTKKLP
jgi:hypothetical protein